MVKRLDFAVKPLLPSRFFELDSEKSRKGLAELYEKDYVDASSSGGQKKDVRDEKLQRQHDEIEQLFENVCNRLDALSNANFTPKAVRCLLLCNLPY